MSFKTALRRFSESRKETLEECSDYLAGLERKLGEFTAHAEDGIKPSPSVPDVSLFSGQSDLEELIRLSVAYYDDNQRIDPSLLERVGISIDDVESEDLIYPFQDARGDEIAAAQKIVGGGMKLVQENLCFLLLPTQFYENYYPRNVPGLLEPLVNVRSVDSMARGCECTSLEFFGMVINHELTHLHAHQVLGLKDYVGQCLPDRFVSFDQDRYAVVLEAAGMAVSKVRCPQFVEVMEKSGDYAGQSAKEIFELSELIYSYCEASTLEETISNIRKEQLALARKAKRAESLDEVEALLKN